VLQVHRGPDLSEEEQMEIFTLSCSTNEEKMNRADELYNAAPWVITVTLGAPDGSDGARFEE
jgi:hypothetical protein